MICNIRWEICLNVFCNYKIIDIEKVWMMSQIKAKLSDELADIMAEVLFIAHELDIDLHSAWDNMLASDQKKISERS